MRKRKNNSVLSRSRRRNFPIKATIYIACFAAIGLLAAFLFLRLMSLNYFKVKDILVSEGRQAEFVYLKGRNIFSINLAKEARYISELYPTYKNVRLIKVLPNRLFIDFIKRSPSAYIKLYRYLCVDDEQAVFDLPVEMGAPDLPVILGLETKIFGPKSGKKYNIPELGLALNIIREFNNSRSLKGYRIKTLDASTNANISFLLLAANPSAGQLPLAQKLIEVRIGQDDVKSRISILGTLLFPIKNDLTNIKYIDLRFKEPVIKFDDVK
jgi:hypothetical protein